MYYYIFSCSQMLSSDDLSLMVLSKIGLNSQLWHYLKEVKVFTEKKIYKNPFVLKSFRNHCGCKSLQKQVSHFKNIVFMFGCFHTFMNLLTLLAIGMLTEGTGLRIIIEVVYGENTFQHMLNRDSLYTFRVHLW